jgi:hypothetical protein
MAAWTVER